MGNQPDNQHQDSVSFLLEEFKWLQESFLRNEELGERRVNFFITLTTAVAGALAAIWKVLQGKIHPIFFIFGLAAVFLFGIVTLVRIIRRNLVTDRYLRGLGRIRKYFASRNPEIELFLPFSPRDDKARTREWKHILFLETGGLVEMVALVNSLVLAVIFALLASSHPWWVMVVLGLLGFVVGWFYQFVYVMHRYHSEKKKIKKEIKFPVPVEIEATLIICSAEPELIAREIAGLSSIKHYRLLPQDSKGIHDRYFDTSDRALERRKLALRVRQIGGTSWITLKGPSQASGWDGVERLEIEEPWSENAVRRVVKELRNRRVQLPPLPEDFSRVDPLDVMISLGLKMIQDRETHREIGNIVFTAKEKGTVLAELAIDSVTYNFGDRKIRHHEVEIEAKVEDGSVVLEKATKGLIEMYGAALRPWKYSKLATGKAIEKLLSEGALEGMLDRSNNLKPVAYDRIDVLLRRGKM